MLVFILSFPLLAPAAETLTITTYYPSPYGVYNEMRAKRIAIGDDYVDTANYTWEETDGDGGEVDYLADLIVEGNVGIGTVNPSSKFHLRNSSYNYKDLIVDSAAPAIRLADSEAHNSFGIIADSRFYITTQTNANRYTAAPGTYLMTIDSSGYVGINSTTPPSRFVVKSSGSPYNAGVFIGGTTAFSILPYDGIVYLSAGTYYENGVWQYYYSGAGASLFAITETGGAHWYSGTGASYSNVASNVTLWNASGTWVGPSSRTLKENFTRLNSDDILNKIDKLNITRWNFKSEGKEITHIGPVAEDFYSIFKTGDAENHLATIDSVGVSLAGVKALHSKIKAQQKEIEEVKKELGLLRAELSKNTDRAAQN